MGMTWERGTESPLRYWNVAEKVYLRRKDQPRTYTMNMKDVKMVSDAAKKKL